MKNWPESARRINLFQRAPFLLFQRTLFLVDAGKLEAGL